MHPSGGAPASPCAWRREPGPADVGEVGRLCAATGFFTPAEVAVAEELVAERLAKGPASGYDFLLADGAEGLLGYACLGPIPCTLFSWDLYWIVVDPAHQGRGLGGRLLAAAEVHAAANRGQRVYVETSSRPLYLPTRSFYLHHGYRVAAELPDFYAPGDAKVVLCKHLPEPRS